MRDVDHRNRDQEGEHGGNQLLLAAFEFEGRVHAVTAQDVAGFQVVAHVGKGRTGGHRKAAQHRQRSGRKAQQQAEQQGDQRHREGREPAGMHGGNADDHFMHEGREGRVEDEGDQHGRRHLGIQPAEQGHAGRQQDVAGAAQAQGLAHAVAAEGLVLGLRLGGFLEQHHAHLHQRDQAGANHHAVGNVGLVDVKAKDRLRVAAQQQADPEHAQRPDVADKGGAEGRHGNLEPGADSADQHAGTQQRRLLAALVARLDGFGCRHTGRPGARCGEYLGVEHAVQQVAVQQHRQRDADEHRQHQIGPAHQERNGNRQQQAVGRAKGRRRDGALRQILEVNRAVTTHHLQGNPRQDHGHQRPEDRGVGRHAQRDQQLDADDGAEDAEQRQQHQVGAGQGLRMELRYRRAGAA